MPRLTQAPSGISCATRAAICSRVNRCMELSLRSMSGGSTYVAPFYLNDSGHIETRGHHRFGIEHAEVDDLVHLRHGTLRRCGHDRTEVACGLAICEIAPAIAALGFDEREITVDRVLEHVVATVDDARLLAFREQRSIACRREERTDAGARGANALSEIALRHQLELHVSRPIKSVEHIRIRLAWEGTNDLAHAAGLEQRSDANFTVARVVGDNGEVCRLLRDERVDELHRQPGGSEAADQNR